MAIEMSNDAYQEAYDYTRRTLGQVQGDLDTEAVEYVEHYLSHTECEMAFEILFLEVMKSGIREGVDWPKALRITETMGLFQEGGVFDYYFVDKLVAYVQGTRHI